MSSITTDITSLIPTLTEGNYHTWAKKVEAKIRLASTWECISPGWTQLPVTGQIPTATEHMEQQEWSCYQGQALGWIIDTISVSNQWLMLKGYHNQTTHSHQYLLLQELACLHQGSKETLPEFFSQVQMAGNCISGAMPQGTTISDLLDTLVSYFGLNNHDSSSDNEAFSKSLQIAGGITLSALTAAYSEEQMHQVTPKVKTERGLATNLSNGKPKPRPGSIICKHCGITGHAIKGYYKLHPDKKPEWMKMKDELQCKAKEAKNGGGREHVHLATPKATQADLEDKEEEHAHMASPHDPSSPHTEADHNWNTDTGATSSMTPHCPWIRNMTPCHIPVHVANDEIVYAQGRGEVIFQPVIDGEPAHSVIFSCVLYVPKLANNLLTIIPMVHKHGIEVKLNAEHMTFKQE
ncbi:hypothetical protein FRB95_007077 [Tulasnella sp. JGI-2019a]|nr:hypothetical protein FRB95_007077 [Tulasnella sp. JGI-2019a]